MLVCVYGPIDAVLKRDSGKSGHRQGLGIGGNNCWFAPASQDRVPV